jgi:hypothetical protein
MSFPAINASAPASLQPSINNIAWSPKYRETNPQNNLSGDNR